MLRRRPPSGIPAAAAGAGALPDRPMVLAEPPCAEGVRPFAHSFAPLRLCSLKASTRSWADGIEREIRRPCTWKRPVLFRFVLALSHPMVARPRSTKRTEFGNVWDERGPSGMLGQWGNRWIAWMWWVFVLWEAEVWLGERAVHYKGRDGEEVMPALLAVRAMLLGYAVECALKALWVRKKGT